MHLIHGSHCILVMNSCTSAQVEDAIGDSDQELELDEEEEQEHHPRKQPAAKAARRSQHHAHARPARTVSAAAISDILAGAPRLVDMLLEEDSIRSITLVCRDVVNLSLAAGGRVELGPVWEALAQRIRCRPPAWLATCLHLPSGACELAPLLLTFGGMQHVCVCFPA